MQRTRRSLLAAGAAAVSALAGCSSTDADDAGTTTRPPPDTETMSPDADALTVSATVARQASADGPPHIDVTLANEGDAPIGVEADPSLFAGSPGTFRGLVLLAADEDMDATHADDCWRVSVDTDAGPAETALQDVPAGGSITQSFDVYTREAADECLPTGTYSVTKELDVTGIAASVSLSLRFEVEDETVSVSARGTEVTT